MTTQTSTGGTFTTYINLTPVYKPLVNGTGVPVDAAMAPTSVGGIPTTMMATAAAKQVIWALTEVPAESVLWWKHWKDILPTP